MSRLADFGYPDAHVRRFRAVWLLIPLAFVAVWGIAAPHGHVSGHPALAHDLATAAGVAGGH